MKHIFFIRHGETEYNKNGQIQGRGINAPLNATGEKQAGLVGKFLQSYQPVSVYSSSLIRARQTADFIRNTLGSFPSLEAAFSELDEMNFGILEGKRLNEISREIHEYHTAWSEGRTHIRVQDGEAPDEVLARSLSKIEAIIAEEENHVAFVLHGRLIRILVSHLLGEGLRNMHHVKHSNGGIYHFVHNGVGMKPVGLNLTGHLAPLHSK